MRTFTRRAGSLFRSAVLLLPLLATAPRLVQAQDDGWAPGTLLVAHRLTSGVYTISQLKLDGTLIRRFGTVSGPEWRSHLAIAGGYLFRSNGMTLNNIHRFDAAGTLVGTTTPDSSAQHQIQAIARDFDDESILLHDV